MVARRLAMHQRGREGVLNLDPGRGYTKLLMCRLARSPRPLQMITSKAGEIRTRSVSWF